MDRAKCVITLKEHKTARKTGQPRRIPIGRKLGELLDQAIGKVADAARKHGKIFGMHGPDGLNERWLPKGLTLVMSNLDTNIINAGLKAISLKYTS